MDQNFPPGDSGLDMIDDENNDGELTIALRNIIKAMKRGVPKDVARRRHGIEGHPAFKDIWPETKYWGDAAWARKLRYGKGPNED